jgi:hypothetical protein
MDQNLDRLRRERSEFQSNLPTDFDGSPNRLGGGVWFNRFGITVPSRTISGRGTFIVDSGNIVLTGNINANDAVGIVARNGDIIIRSSVTSLDRVYLYAPNGAIQFEDSPEPLNATGSFIAQSFVLPAREIGIRYDTSVALNPPPGFVSFILPTVLERAP